MEELSQINCNLATLASLFGCQGNVKIHGYTFDISKYPRGINEQLLKVSSS